MRAALMLYGTLLFGMACLRTGDEPQPDVSTNPAQDKQDVDSSQAPADPASVAAENEIREISAAFVKAYEEGNAAAAAALFADKSEYVDEFGNVTQGRSEIQTMLKDFFSEHPSCTLEVKIDSIRFLSPQLAVEDGSARVTHVEHLGSDAESKASKDETKDGETLVLPQNLPGFTVQSRYTVTYIKSDNGWQMASLRDFAHKGRKDHQSQLMQLKWLEGEWLDEGEEATVTFSCKASDGGNYLLRSFAILINNKETLTGTQRIGWDPLARKLRAWIFDSEGGYADGFWHRDGDNWILKCSGVTAEGETASYTAVYRLINEHTMTWQYVDYEVEGIQQPDSEIFMLVRQAPVPAPTVADRDGR